MQLAYLEMLQGSVSIYVWAPTSRWLKAIRHQRMKYYMTFYDVWSCGISPRRSFLHHVDTRRRLESCRTLAPKRNLSWMIHDVFSSVGSCRVESRWKSNIAVSELLSRLRPCSTGCSYNKYPNTKSAISQKCLLMMRQYCTQAHETLDLCRPTVTSWIS